jgi:hypothetical protein
MMRMVYITAITQTNLLPFMTALTDIISRNHITHAAHVDGVQDDRYNSGFPIWNDTRVYFYYCDYIPTFIKYQKNN